MSLLAEADIAARLLPLDEWLRANELDGRDWDEASHATDESVTVTDVIVVGAGPRTGHHQGVVRHDGRPVGPVIWGPWDDAGSVTARARMLARTRIARPLPDPFMLSVSLVIPTCGRPELLARCIESVIALDAPGLEVVIVDNRPSDPSGRRVFDLLAPHCPAAIELRYLAEPVPGASRARNLGWRATSGEIVAFCDDDCVVDRYWIEGIRRAFADDVDAVTGQVLPLEQATIAQVHFEQYGGFGRGPEPCRFDLVGHRPSSPFFPYTAGRFGSGNNAAVRRCVLEAIGGFSEALGPGTPAHAGEDLDLFVSVLRRGGVLAYEPSALVWHRHRPEPDELAGQLRCYGVGLSAMITKQAMSSRVACREVARLIVPGTKLLLSPTSSKNIGRTGDYPRGLVRAELAGIAIGPLRYRAARRREKRLGGSPRPLESLVRIIRPASTDALYRNALALACNSVGTAVLGLIYWAVAARLYPATEVGRASALISAMTLCSGIAQLNLIQGLPRFLPVAGAATARFVRRAYGASLSVAVLIASIALLGSARGWWGGSYLRGSTAMSVWFVTAVAAWTLFTLQDAVLIGLGQSIWVPIENVTFSVVKIGLLVVGAQMFQRHGVFLSFTVPVAMTLVPVNLMLFRRLIPRHQKAATRPRPGPASPAGMCRRILSWPMSRFRPRRGSAARWPMCRRLSKLPVRFGGRIRPGIGGAGWTTFAMGAVSRARWRATP